MKILFLIASLFFTTAEAKTAFSIRDKNTGIKITATSEIGMCVLESAQKYGIDPYLIWAIKMTESGRSLDGGILNIDNPNGSYDIGLMQINSSVWLKPLAKYSITEDMLKDPCTNIDVGTWILAQSIKRHGVREGIGRYHSGTPKFKNVYIPKVLANWKTVLEKAYGRDRAP